MILVAARGVYYAATMLLFGDAAFNALLRGTARGAGLRGAALVLALAAGCVWLAQASAQMADEPADTAIIMQVLQGTLFGQVLAARMVALLLLGLAFLSGAGDVAAAILSAIALALPAVTSHAAASSPAGFAAIGATLDAVHLLTAGFWIGGLAVLVQRRRESNLGAALARFSDWAMIAVLLLVMTGMIDAASILFTGAGKPSALYLGVLGGKLLLVLAMLGLATINRFGWLPRNDTDTIVRNAMLELALGAGVVALAGCLGQLQPTL